MTNNRRTVIWLPIIRILFLIYVGLMIWLLFIQRMDSDITANGDNLNLVPLKTLKLYWGLLASHSAFYFRLAIVNLVGNVVMFIPFGFFIPVIWNRFGKFFSFLTLSALLVVFIEVLQYITSLGSCDIDDFILNFPGMILGYIISRIIAVRP